MGDETEYLLALAKTQGAACATVSDGHVLILRKDHLERLMSKNPDSELLVVFVQRGSDGPLRMDA